MPPCIWYQENFITLGTVKLFQWSRLPKKTVQPPSEKVSRPNRIKPDAFLSDPIVIHASNRKLDQGLPEVFYSLWYPAFLYIICIACLQESQTCFESESRNPAQENFGACCYFENSFDSENYHLNISKREFLRNGAVISAYSPSAWTTLTSSALLTIIGYHYSQPWLKSFWLFPTI